MNHQFPSFTQNDITLYRMTYILPHFCCTVFVEPNSCVMLESLLYYDLLGLTHSRDASTPPPFF